MNLDIEKKLSTIHENNGVLLTGNATAGIYLVLKSLGLKDKRIAVPNNVCINVPIAVNLSGNSVEYLDISKETLGLSVKHLKERISRVDAVIAVHSYGSPCEIGEIKKTCAKSSVPLIEDFAVAQGANVNNKPVGSFGDVSITSFGAGKILDSGHGGAVLTNNRELLAEIVKEENLLNGYVKENSDKISQLTRFYRQLYNDHYGSDIDKYIPNLQRRIEDVQDAFLFKFDEHYREIISRNIDGLRDNIKRRAENAEKFRDKFNKHSSNGIKIFNSPLGEAYWRFNIFIDRNRNNLLKYLLTKKYMVSSWYPSVDIFFKSRIKSDVITPVSDQVGDSILNLWVNGEIDDHYIIEITNEIVAFLERNQDGKEQIYPH